MTGGKERVVLVVANHELKEEGLEVGEEGETKIGMIRYPQIYDRETGGPNLINIIYFINGLHCNQDGGKRLLCPAMPLN